MARGEGACGGERQFDGSGGGRGKLQSVKKKNKSDNVSARLIAAVKGRKS